ncbi:MAG: ABC transporter ATP-binding protein [Candidatus Handelsmanbacteria bacterium]|nr:ABC transporter ATP-binding protein [Candidatus Handelsmanbacteria bacterium]
MNLLEIKNLKTYIETNRGVVRCVDGVSFDIRRGETLGLVGESGCGKSMTARSIIGMVNAFPGVVEGEILFAPDGASEPANLAAPLQYTVEVERNEKGELVALRKAAKRWQKEINQIYRQVRGTRISIIFQDPQTSLNPFWTVGAQLREAIRMGEQGKDRGEEELEHMALKWLERVYVPRDKLNAYPHELNGGACQRVMIAIGLASKPDLVIADEPTTGLDVTIQACIVELFRELKQTLGTTVLLISHDMGLIGQLSDRMAVMYCGRIVELGPRERILDFELPQRHPYTVALLKLLPNLEVLKKGGKLQVIEQEVPNPLTPPPGCAFHPRCEVFKGHREQLAECTVAPPGKSTIDRGHWACCWALAEVRPSVQLLAEPAPTSLRDSQEAPERDPQVLVSAEQVSKFFPVRKKKRSLWGTKHAAQFKALDAVSMKVYKGETLGLVGESGCGKTTLGLALLRLISQIHGKVYFDGCDVFGLEKKELRKIRRRMQMIFQDPYAALNNHMKVEEIVAEGVRINFRGSKKEVAERAEGLLAQVNLQKDKLRQYPFELSGGERRRVGIARTLAVNPEFIIADEPVAALDVSIKSQVINLLQDLKEQSSGLSYLFISHDIGVIKYVSDRIAVMYLGKVVEVGANPTMRANRCLHPYTYELLKAAEYMSSAWESGYSLDWRQEAHSWDEPDQQPSGCRYHPRCSLYRKMGLPVKCETEDPELIQVESYFDTPHEVACHFFAEMDVCRNKDGEP